MKIYQNAEICCERKEHGRRLREKTSKKPSKKSCGALYFRRLPRSLPESDPDLKNLYIQKRLNGFKKRK